MLAWSYRRILVFWWILLLVIQQAERLFLLPEALSLESPSGGTLAKTLWIGFRADLITATFGVLLAVLLGGFIGVFLSFSFAGRKFARSAESSYRLGLVASSGLIGLLMLILLTVDMGYYYFNHQHLNFVFVEYLDDLLAGWRGGEETNTQAVRQTGAELGDEGKWGLRLAGFYLLQFVAVFAWWGLFSRTVSPVLSRRWVGSTFQANIVLVLGLTAGVLGFHHEGPHAIRIADISSGTYYTLAQNPIMYAGEALRAFLKSEDGADQLRDTQEMLQDEAILLTQEALGRDHVFPFQRFPLVRETRSAAEIRFDRPANVLVVFMEGLDRRFLGKTIKTTKAGSVEEIPLTPFLDRLKDESVYFSNFFSNGTQTSRGLFASFCSYYPRQGTSAMKTRYTRDYVCLPSLLRKSGYRTEMVISQHRDLNRLQRFMSRNGLHQLLDETDFPSGAERLGLGFTDGALFDLVAARIEALQNQGEPFFLTTMTLSTHHPFVVPLVHPDVRALKDSQDGYIAALRYMDLQFERVFRKLRRKGLLHDTVVFILGDHGRHERIGTTELEKQAGHFMAPLFVWLDDSLRTPENYRPRIVSSIASQVDLTPTILGILGLTPAVSPFLGQNLSCLLASDCLDGSFAFLSSVYDDLIGLADNEGLLLYSLRTGILRMADLQVAHPTVVATADSDLTKERRFRKLLALHVSSNTLLDQNRIWSWTELGGKL